MTLNKALYWFLRLLLLLLLGSAIFLTGVTLAMLIVRVLPLTAFLTSNANTISRAQGAQFINAAYGISSLSGPWWQKIKIDPLVPAFIGISILKKIKPIDNLLKRIIPEQNGNYRGRNANPSSNYSFEIPDTGRLQGIAPGDSRALEKVKGHFLNIGLAFLFLLLVLFCIFIISSLFKSFVSSFNTQSKKLVYGTVELSKEIKALPAVMDDLKKNNKSVKKKATSKTTKK